MSGIFSSSTLETSLETACTSDTRDAFLVEGEGGVEDDLTGCNGGVRWLLDSIAVVGRLKWLTSMKETDLPRFRGGGKR